MPEEQDTTSRDSGMSSMPSGYSSPTRMSNLMVIMESTTVADILIDENAQCGFENVATMANDNKKHLVARMPLRQINNDSDSSMDSRTLLESPISSRKRSNFLHAGLFDFQNKDALVVKKAKSSYDQIILKQEKGLGTPSQKSKKRSLAVVPVEEKRAKTSSDANCISLDEMSQMDDDVFNLTDFESPNVSNYSMHSEHRQSSGSGAFLRANSCSVLEMHSTHAPQLPPVLDVQFALPAVDKPQKESLAFRSISAATLADEIRRLGDQFSEKYVVVDCRYPYEYEGRHVKTAINIHDQEEIGKKFFPRDSDKIPIFYCEFSQKRGPGMALKLRSIDRTRNELAYPNVDYKEMYLLDRGYRNLWLDGSFKDVCEPQSYTPMEQEEHRSQLKTFRWHKSKSSTNVSRLGINKERLRASRRGLFVDHRVEVIRGSVSTGPTLTTRAKSMAPPDADGLRNAVSIPSLLDFDSSLEHFE